MSAHGAERELMTEIDCFRFCPSRHSGSARFPAPCRLLRMPSWRTMRRPKKNVGRRQTHALQSRFYGRYSRIVGGVMQFWTEPQMASIHKMLNPRSIAIVGATPRMQYGGGFLVAGLKTKDRAPVFYADARRMEIMGGEGVLGGNGPPEAPGLGGSVVPL